MKERLSRWGVGPRIAAAAGAYAALAGAATRRWPGILRVQFASKVVSALLAGVLVTLGVTMLVVAAR